MCSSLAGESRLLILRLTSAIDLTNVKKGALKTAGKRKSQSASSALSRDCNLALKLVELEDRLRGAEIAGEYQLAGLDRRLETLEAGMLDVATPTDGSCKTCGIDFSNMHCGDGFPASHDPKPTKWARAWRWLRLGA